MNPTFSPKKFLNHKLLAFTCFLLLLFSSLQDLHAQTGCSIIKTGCPPADLISPVCATHEVSGVLGANVSWTPPSFTLSCPGEGGSGYAFNMEFDLNESLSAAGCWEYNKVQRVGTSGGKLRLWQSTGTGDPWVKTPGFYLTGTTNLQLTIYAVENFTVNVYLINTTTLVETLATTTPALNIIGNSTLTDYPFTITPPSVGAYKFRIEFVGGSSNANVVQVLSINATVLGGCTGDVNFATTSNVNPGSFFAVGCTTVTYTAVCNSCTSPGPLTETCTFQVCVNGIKASITNNSPTSCGLSNGSITFDTSGAKTAISQVQYMLDAGAWTTITSPFTINGISGGAHTLNVRALFGATYCTILAPINFNITTNLDATPPSITCPTPAASYNTDAGLCTSSQSFTATATDLCDPSPTVKYYIGATEISFPYAFPAGTTTVKAEASDAIGNKSDCSFNVVVVDNQPPTLSGTLPTGASNQNFCFANIPIGPTEAAIQALYSDNCNGVITVTKSGTPTGNNCSWSVTYTYEVKDQYNNIVNPSPTITYSGGDKTAPTGTAPTGTSNINACYVDATTPPTGTPAFNPTTAAAGYSDNCSGTVTATLTNTAVTGNNCSWTVTYTFKVADACGNELTGQTIQHTGGDKTAPTGTAPAGSNNINACYVDGTTPPTGTPAFNPTTAAAGYTDNCSGTVTATLTNTAVTGNNCSWTVTYTFKVADACGNELTGQTIQHTGGDKTAPTGTSPTGSSNINACYVDATTPPTGTPAFNPTTAAAGYSDNCSGTVTATLTNTAVTGNNCSWTVTYTFKVADACGNELSGQTIQHTGGDKTAPTGTAPAGSNNINACYVNATTPPTGTPAFNPTTAAAGYSDNCSGTVTATLTNTAVTGNNCSWTVTYTFKVTDACGNELTGQTIQHTGGDKTAPTGTAPTGSSNINACYVNATTPPTGTPAFNPTTAAAGYSDNCSGTVTATLTNTAVTGNNCSWTVTYTFKVSDACGNELTGQTIQHTGGDKTAPTGTAPTGTNNINACFVDGNTAPAGVPAFNATTAAAGYSDNCGGTVIATLTGTSITGTSCSWSVVYTFKVADACGNELTGQTITHSGGDKTAPTGTAPAGTSNINACFVNSNTAPTGTPAFNATTAAAGYSDNCGGTVTATLTGTSITGTNCSWSVVYTFKVADACGNELTGQTITHTGGDKTAPTGTAPTGTSNINACFVNTSTVPTGVPAFNATTAASGYSDNCGGTVTATLTGTTISGNNAAWTVVYTFKVADACGNELTGQTITHSGKNQTAPTITQCAASSSASAGVNCTAPVPNFAVSTQATSPCGAQVVFTKTQSPAAGTLVGLGPHTVTITVTDDAGNSVTCTATFTVNDNTAPTITCPANITTADDGCGTAIVGITPPNASDNCTGTVIPVGVRSDGLPLTAPYPIGVTTITWTATDATNHTSTCIQTITVTKSNGTILANYTFLGFTAYPFNANETAPGISSNATSTEAFAYTGSGTPSGPGAYKNNPGTNEALVLQPSSGENTRYVQYVVSGATLKYYSQFKVYFQAERQPQGATAVTLAYSLDGITYTNVGSPLAITDQTTWYEGIYDLSSIAALNTFNLTTIYFRLYASGSDAKGSSDATRLEIDNFQVFAAGVGPTITCPGPVTVSCPGDVVTGTATGEGRCGTPNISATRSDGLTMFDSYPEGVTTITWKATDENGVFATCTQTITVTGPIANCVIVPVTGLQLKGQRNGPDVHLNWFTVTEQNTSHFVMERSFDGVRFEPLNNKVPAAGNSNALRNYNLVDKNVPGAVVYYRVKMYDNNGQMKMSNLVAITMNVSKQLRVYPNPVKDFVTIEFGAPGNYQVDLISDNGQLVLVQKDVQITNSFRTLTMQRNNLVSGQYQMRIWNKTTGKVDIVRLVYLPKNP